MWFRRRGAQPPESASAPPGGTAPSGTYDKLRAQTDAAIDQLRSLAKWVATAAAGAASLLLAGVQLTSIGKVTASHLFLSIAGLSCALASAVVVVWAVSDVLSPRITGPEDVMAGRDADLAKFLDQHPSLLVGEGSFAKFRAAHAAAAAKEAQERTEHERKLLRAANLLLPFASLLTAQRAFSRAMRYALLAVVVGGAGAVVFAWASGQAAPATPEPAVHPAMVEVTLHLSQEGSERLAGRLTQECVNSALSNRGASSIATSADEDSVTVILIPSDSCPSPVELTVPLSDGYADPISSVAPPIPASEP